MPKMGLPKLNAGPWEDHGRRLVNLFGPSCVYPDGR